MTLPDYAMNQVSFPEMYERWLVGPLFRPWAELTLDEVQLSQGDVVAVMERIKAARGVVPQRIQVDNGSELSRKCWTSGPMFAPSDIVTSELRSRCLPER